MQENTKDFSLVTAMVVTGLAFLIGGIFRTILLRQLGPSGSQVSVLLMILTVWSGFLIEAICGITVLAFLFKKYYQFRKLWVAGVKAFALGSVLPALVLNQFFYLILILPGILIGLLFDRYLNERAANGRFPYWITLGFFIGQLLVFYAPIDMPWMIWLSEQIGWGISNIMYLITDIIIGIFVALAVGLLIREKNNAFQSVT